MIAGAGRLFRREPSLPHELLGLGVILGELFAVPLAPPVEPAVAHMPEEQTPVLDQPEGQGGAHFPEVDIVPAGVQNALIGRLEDALEPRKDRLLGRLRWHAGTGEVPHRLHGQATGQLAAVPPTHAVGDHGHAPVVQHLGAIFVVFPVALIGPVTGV